VSDSTWRESYQRRGADHAAEAQGDFQPRTQRVSARE
jgi:hypothetical protein